MFSSVQIMMVSSYCIKNLNSKANNDVHNFIGPVVSEVCKQLCSEDGDKNAENEKYYSTCVFFVFVLCFSYSSFQCFYVCSEKKVRFQKVFLKY